MWGRTWAPIQRKKRREKSCIHRTTLARMSSISPCVQKWRLFVRVIQFLLTVSIFALALYAIIPLPFERVTVFILFTSIWTGVIVIPSAALVPFYLYKWSCLVTLVIEVAALGLWLAVFLTVTVFLHSVGNNYGGDIRSAWISTIVLSALEWVLFASTTIKAALEFTRSG